MVKKIIIACTLVCMTTMVSSVSLAKTIDKGQRGHHVSKVQTMLKHQGFLHDSVDGIYGHNTEQAVRKFQKSKGLAVDGRVGPATMNALEKMETRYGGHGTALSTIINYFDASFGYEEFMKMKNKMPWIVEFQFDSEAHCHAICKHDLF